MGDLVERLKTELREANEAKVDLPWLEEAIAALSPTMPDDVAELIGELEGFGLDGYGSELTQRAADLLERQARQIIEMQTYCDETATEKIELHERIEELTGIGCKVSLKSNGKTYTGTPVKVPLTAQDKRDITDFTRSDKP